MGDPEYGSDEYYAKLAANKQRRAKQRQRKKASKRAANAKPFVKKWKDIAKNAEMWKERALKAESQLQADKKHMTKASWRNAELLKTNKTLEKGKRAAEREVEDLRDHLDNKLDELKVSRDAHAELKFKWSRAMANLGRGCLEEAATKPPRRNPNWE